MALSKEAYQALEDIVGPENISEEPAILDSYTWMRDNELRTPGRSGWHVRRPEAAVMPGSAEEVQAIIKACNRYRIKCRPFSTGWVAGALVATEGAINLDLRRMNRILDIDEKNMFAVVEPYVITAQLQAEAMKVGLTPLITGAGSSCSALAGATAGGGSGPGNFFMGNLNENLLAMEWVMPNGDILRTGSLGSGVGWFCGEGPGPSLRGVVRGTSGALGVFTKCAIKLSPWPGPAVMPVEGTVPAYNSPLPENIKAYCLVEPSWQALADAYYKIYDAEIGYIGEREFEKWGENLWPAYLMMYNDPTKSLDDLEDFVNKPEIQKLTDEVRHYDFQFILAGMTPEDAEYQEKVLDQILADTGGHRVAAMSEPRIQRFIALCLIRLPIKHDNNVLAGGRQMCFAPQGVPDLVVKNIPPVIELMRKYEKKGALVKTGGDTLKGRVGAMGGGGVFGLEESIMWDPSDIDSVDGTREYWRATIKLCQELGFNSGHWMWVGAGEVSTEEQQATLARAAQPARFHWQWKIKQVLDPNDAGDSKNYPALKEPPKE